MAKRVVLTILAVPSFYGRVVLRFLHVQQEKSQYIWDGTLYSLLSGFLIHVVVKQCHFYAFVFRCTSAALPAGTGAFACPSKI